MILYWYIHWFWITLIYSGFVVTIPPEPPNANDSLLIRPSVNSLSPNVDNNLNLFHPNRTVTTKTSTTTTRTTAVQSAITLSVNDHDSVKENDIFNQPPMNAAEANKVALVDDVRPSHNVSNILAMGYTNNSSFEDDRFSASLNDTYTGNVTDLGPELNMTHSSMTNSNLIDLNKPDSVGGDMGENVDGGAGEEQLTAAGITSITVGCVAVVGLLTATSFLLYRYRSVLPLVTTPFTPFTPFNRPEALNDYCTHLDSIGYIDDTSIRDNSEEMYSLDNDSFLNSLEAMTIQNYWTDKVKHTKL